MVLVLSSNFGLIGCRPMVSEILQFLGVLSACPVCDVRVLWPNGCMDQDETWRASRPRPWSHCVRWGPSYPSPKGHSPPIFGPYLSRPNGCMDQDATWYGARPRPRRLYVRWGPRSLPTKGAQPPPQFSAHVYWGQTAGWIKMVLGTEVGLSPGHFVLDGDRARPLNFRPIFIIMTVISL